MHFLKQLFTKDFWKGVALLNGSAILRVRRFFTPNRVLTCFLFSASVFVFGNLYQDKVGRETFEDSAVLPAVSYSRMSVESTFRWPDPALSGDDTSRAAILKDAKTGDCFLYLWSGMASGGAAMAPIDCDPADNPVLNNSNRGTI